MAITSPGFAEPYRNEAGLAHLLTGQKQRDFITGSLADDTSFNLGPVASVAQPCVLCVGYDGSANNVALFIVNSDTITVAGDGTANGSFDDADTDAKFDVYVLSSDLVVKNRLGETASFFISRIM